MSIAVKNELLQLSEKIKKYLPESMENEQEELLSDIDHIMDTIKLEEADGIDSTESEPTYTPYANDNLDIHHKGYFLVNLISILLQTTEDRSLQVAFGRMDLSDFAIVMKCLPADVIEDRIFPNVSRKTREQLREDMQCMGPVLEKEIAEAADKVMASFLVNLRSHNWSLGDNGLFEKMAELFSVQVNEQEIERRDDLYSGLSILLHEFRDVYMKPIV